MSINEGALNQMLEINAYISGDYLAQLFGTLVSEMDETSKEELMDSLKKFSKLVNKVNSCKFQDKFYIKTNEMKYKYSFFKIFDINYSKDYLQSRADELEMEELWFEVSFIIDQVLEQQDNLDIETIKLAVELAVMFVNYYRNETNKNAYFDYKKGFQSSLNTLIYTLCKNKFRFVDGNYNQLRNNINSNMYQVKSKLKESH